VRLVKCLFVVLALAGGLLVAGSAEAQADERYAAFVIRNPTNVAINYQIKWGDGDWKSIRVNAGYCYEHYHPLDADDMAPRPYIRFNGVGNGDKEYCLGFYATRYPSNGKRYVFRYAGRRLDLYSD
jgi:hypothetical protein